MPQIDYTVETSKSFDEAVQAVQDAIADKGFRVLAVHDVQATLAEKGFERSPLKIVETCNAKYASQVLEKDVSIALMLPCPISVYEQDGKVFISTMRPSLIGAFYPEAGIEAEADAVQRIIFEIVDEAAK